MAGGNGGKGSHGNGGGNKPNKGGGRPTPNKDKPGKGAAGKRSGAGKKKVDALGKGLLGKTPNALKGDPRKALEQQAKKLMKDVYAPALHDVTSQIQSTKEVDAKRAADNKYYLDWLKVQNDELKAHADAADAELRARQSEIEQNRQEAMQGVRGELLAGMNEHADTVSAEQNSKSLDYSPESDRALGEVAAERTRSEQAIGTNQMSRQTEGAANFGQMVSMDAKRQADTFKRLGELGDAKTKVKLERAAASSQEVARLLDREVDKATARTNMKNMAGQLAVALKEQRLNSRKFKFEKRSQLKQLNETERSNKADEANDRYANKTDRMSEKETKRHNKAMESLEHDQNKIDKLEAQQGGNDNKQDKRKATRLVKSVVNNGIVAIKTDPKLKKLAQKNPNAAVTKLRKQGADAIYAKASVELATKGSISQSTRRALEQLGIQIPPQWLK